MGKIKKVIAGNKLLIFILLVALFVRVYRVNQLLGFWYDQGRDALVIWNLWHKGKLFLIGPTTGLQDVFLGPLYYYLIAPFYLIGRGNPVYPAVFLSFTTVVASGVLYFLGKKYHSRKAGLLASLITAISYQIVYLSRWLSNPTPIFLTSVILLYLFTKLLNREDKKLWIFVSLVIGISLNFEAASAFFYIPVSLVTFLAIFLKYKKKQLPSFKIIFISLLVFVFTQSPQILFNFRHNNIFLSSFSKAVLIKENVSSSLIGSLKYRSSFYWDSFSKKIIPESSTLAALSFLVMGLSLVLNIKKLKSNPLFVALIIFLFVPLMGYTLFKGNYGQLLDYYLMGYYFPFILFVSILITELWNAKYLKYLAFSILAIFLWQNTKLTKSYITTGLNGPASVLLGNQMIMIDWIYKDAENNPFNLDVYVPPVIPYSYEYLFKWQNNKRCKNGDCGLKGGGNLDLLYTIYEADFPHPERLQSWLLRQKGIGLVEKEYQYGGITVQRRSRF